MGQFIEHFNGPPIELFNITFNPWHTKANNLHLNFMQLIFNYIFNNKINYYYKLRSKLSHNHPLHEWQAYFYKIATIAYLSISMPYNHLIKYNI